MENQETAPELKMEEQPKRGPKAQLPQLNRLQTQTPSLNATSSSFSERLHRLKVLGQEEMRAFAQKPTTPIPMSPKEYEEVATSLKNGSVQWKRAARWLSNWFVLTQDEGRTRQFFRAWFHLKDQFWDKDQMSVPKGTFTISVTEIEQLRPLFDSMERDLEYAKSQSPSQGPAQNNIRLQTQGGSLAPPQALSSLLTPQSARKFWTDPLSPQTPIAREQGWGYPTIQEKLAISTNTEDRSEADDRTPIAPIPASQFTHFSPVTAPPKGQWQFPQDPKPNPTSDDQMDVDPMSKE